MPPRSSSALRAFPDTVEVPGRRCMETVSDETLLAVVLAMANPAGDAETLALRLLAEGRSLADAAAAVAQGRSPIGDLNADTTVQFNAVVELAARLVRPSMIRHPVFLERDAMVTYCRLRAMRSPVETVRLLFLDDGKRLIADEIHRTGAVDHIYIYARDILCRALELRARGLVVAHSAPRDEPPPASGPKRICIDLQRAGTVLGLDLHSYLLIGRQSYRCLVQEQTEQSSQPRRLTANGGGKAQRVP
jgi:DNA repair protein RadC